MQVKRPHVLPDEGDAQTRRTGLLRRNPQHILAQIHARKMESPLVQGDRQAARAAGALADLALANAEGSHQPYIEVSPGVIIDVPHQLIINLCKTCIHSYSLSLPVIFSFAMQASADAPGLLGRETGPTNLSQLVRQTKAPGSIIFAFFLVTHAPAIHVPSLAFSI